MEEWEMQNYFEISLVIFMTNISKKYFYLCQVLVFAQKIIETFSLVLVLSK